jgi:hypothetical protein
MASMTLLTDGRLPDRAQMQHKDKVRPWTETLFKDNSAVHARYKDDLLESPARDEFVPIMLER